jgi:hypothetical protein
MMESSCPWLSLVMRAGFTVMTLKQSNNPPKRKVKSMLIVFFDIKGIVHKEFVLTGQTANSKYCCDIIWQLHENVRRLRPEH